MPDQPLAIIVFFLTLGMTVAVAICARLRSPGASSEEDLAGRTLNKWLIGLSAATTGNSGFIVTGAVGLGYVGGAQWLLLPLGWLMGDLVYWSLFPDRINKLARESKAITLPELLTHDLEGPTSRGISLLVAVILTIFLTIYTSAQWLAGEKFLGGVLHLGTAQALLIFGAIIVLYSAIGGFRGSVYVDTLQAVIRLGGTALALWLVCSAAMGLGDQFWANVASAGGDFLSLTADRGLVGAGAFALGFAGAAVGFGLGQPQIITRYMAGESPEETKAARWIYILFLQVTWLSMTIFGMVLRGVDPGISDPETGLSLFFQHNVGAIATGIIFADVFATIAGTANGVLISISQTIRRDMLRLEEGGVKHAWIYTLVLGLISIALSFWLPGDVYTIAVGAISMIGAALAGAVLIKIFQIRHSARSILLAIVAGTSAAAIWRTTGLSGTFNETAIGIAASLVVNYLFRVRRVHRI